MDISGGLVTTTDPDFESSIGDIGSVSRDTHYIMPDFARRVASSSVDSAAFGFLLDPTKVVGVYSTSDSDNASTKYDVNLEWSVVPLEVALDLEFSNPENQTRPN